MLFGRMRQIIECMMKEKGISISHQDVIDIANAVYRLANVEIQFRQNLLDAIRYEAMKKLPD